MSVHDEDENPSLEARVIRIAYNGSEGLEKLASTEVVQEQIISLAVREFAIGLSHRFEGLEVQIEHALIATAAQLKHWRLDRQNEGPSK